jgi:TrmH family RNA methyltransferase
MSADLVSALSPADASQGVVALAARPRWEAEALFPPGRIALLVVALGVQDPGNVGALFRSAEAAGATGMVLGDGTADPFAWKALRGSMGSAFRLPHLRTGGTDALALLRRHGVRLLAAAADAPRPLWETDLGGALAILVGAEGRGLPPAVRAAADLAVRIPMAAPVESLNVGVAAAVLLYEAARQRLTSAGGRGKGDRPPAGAR